MASNNEDMLSQLTDPLVFIILSSLPFKEAARTSVLSKRWRHLWRETRNIEFDESFFVKQNEESTAETKQIQRRAFIDFSRKWIQHYGELNLDSFRLVFSKPQNDLVDVHNCIRFAIAHRVKALDLDFSDPTWDDEDNEDHEPVTELPPFVYKYGAFESLKLTSCNFRVFGFRYFGALKSLSLGCIRLWDYTVDSLLSNCRLIESLSLKKCWDVGYLRISSPILTTLVLEDNLDLDLEVSIRVEAQKLRFFKYHGSLTAFYMKDLNNLEEVDLDFVFEDDHTIGGDVLYVLLGRFRSIRVLSVCHFMLSAMGKFMSLEPPLDNVKHLKLKSALYGHEYRGIAFFLHTCPHLEILTIDTIPPRIIDPEHDEVDHEFFKRRYRLALMVFECVRSSLRVVEVKGFKGRVNEVEVLQYFLCSGHALEAISITVAKEKGPDAAYDERLYRRIARRFMHHGRFSRPSVRVSIHQ